MTDKQFLKRYDTKSPFNEVELKNIIWDTGKTVVTIEGDSGRWHKEITTIKQVDNRYFKIIWDQALTEQQENEYFFQPVECVPDYKEVKVLKVSWLDVINNE